MQLQSPKLCVIPPPQLSSHPQPQFVAAKSLILYPPKNFDYTYMICAGKELVQLLAKNFKYP